MEGKVNYYQMMVEELEKIKESGKRPRLLMHVCCGPCSTFPVEFLPTSFDVTLYFNNSNIYPSAEYERRLEELKRYLAIVNKNSDHPIQLIVTPYKNEEYNQMLALRKDDREGDLRCKMCYERRMEEACAYAASHQFDYFTTVMTISRQKDSQVLNQIGEKIVQCYPNIKYFYSDFKKKQGIDRKEELVKRYDMYRQQYCGCVYSYQDYLVRKKLEVK